MQSRCGRSRRWGDCSPMTIAARRSTRWGTLLIRRDQLEHAIRTACQILGHSEVIIVGSQSILGTYDECELPRAATLSREVDVLPVGRSGPEITALADRLAGVAGEFSRFEALHGFSIDGVDLETAILPQGWRDRLVRVSNVNTAAPSGEPVFTGWCLDKEDLCVAKLCAFREKDREFVGALLAAALVERTVIGDRLDTVADRHTRFVLRAKTWLANP